jgi:hypothetical protein
MTSVVCVLIASLHNLCIELIELEHIVYPHHANSSSSALASWRSAVSNPSLNQP